VNKIEGAKGFLKERERIQGGTSNNEGLKGNILYPSLNATGGAGLLSIFLFAITYLWKYLMEKNDGANSNYMNMI
jgi:hypothetical protein